MDFQLHLHQQHDPARCSQWIFHDVPSDITITVNGAIFALHKFPLVSRSAKMRKLVRDTSDASKMELRNLPGGVETFELAAKFCYGINFEVTPGNVAQLRCISEYLEMTETVSKDNLASRAEEYLETVVCKNLEMCVEVLRHCESLLPLADDLRVVGRCVDGVSAKACSEQIASSFSRLEYSSSGRLHMGKNPTCEDWWIEDLSTLRVDMFERVVLSMKRRGVRPESVGSSLVNYAKKELTKNHPVYMERSVVETVVSLLPDERNVVPISFLFGLLRSAVVLECASPCQQHLEKRIAAQLEFATIDDLLIPSFKNACDTLFDVDTVHRIVETFSQHEDDMENASVFENDILDSPSQTALLKVSNLVDNYLSQIAPDTNLKFSKFMVIAGALPNHARADHDGLYRAIDVYLKAHQNLTDSERKKLSKLIDFQKLSEEATAHAAQNERLPLQAIVQVLYYEQVRLRNSFCAYPDEEEGRKAVHGHPSWRGRSGAFSASMSPRDNYASLRRENRELKLEVARLRMRLSDLEKEHICMKRQMQMSMQKGGSRKLMSSFTRKMAALKLFGGSSSRGSTSPSKSSQRPMERTCASTD